MNKTYTVTLADEYTVGGKIGVPVTIDGNHTAWICTGIELTPYTEPNLEAIRNEAYEKGVQDTKQHWVDAPRSCAYQLGYENGLKAAWDVARKIESLSSREFDKAFTGYDDCFKVFENYTPQEAIEKIKQCGQEQEDAEFRVGDEFITKNNKDLGVIIAANAKRVLVLWKDDTDIFVENNREFTTKWAKERFVKTGRHFPEIAEVFKRMNEETA